MTRACYATLDRNLRVHVRVLVSVLAIETLLKRQLAFCAPGGPHIAMCVADLWETPAFRDDRTPLPVGEFSPVCLFF